MVEQNKRVMGYRSFVNQYRRSHRLAPFSARAHAHHQLLFPDVSEDWRPPAELEAFLAAGDPPVYVGVGSMAVRALYEPPEKTSRARR
jgi:hypothetical protein